MGFETLVSATASFSSEPELLQIRQAPTHRLSQQEPIICCTICPGLRIRTHSRTWTSGSLSTYVALPARLENFWKLAKKSFIKIKFCNKMNFLLFLISHFLFTLLADILLRFWRKQQQRRNNNNGSYTWFTKRKTFSRIASEPILLLKKDGGWKKNEGIGSRQTLSKNFLRKKQLVTAYLWKAMLSSWTRMLFSESNLYAHAQISHHSICAVMKSHLDIRVGGKHLQITSDLRETLRRNGRRHDKERVWESFGCSSFRFA